MTTGRANHHRQGVTLVEVLAATALLAALMVGVVGWLRMTRHAGHDAHDALVEARHMQAAVRLLRDDLRLARPGPDGEVAVVTDDGLQLQTLHHAGRPPLRAGEQPSLQHHHHQHGLQWQWVRYRIQADRIDRETAWNEAGPWHSRPVLTGIPPSAFVSDDTAIRWLIDPVDSDDLSAGGRYAVVIGGSQP